MDLRQLLNLHETTCNRCREVMEKKNHDYTSGSGDPFANFRSSELMVGVEAEKGILLRTSDKMQRMRTYIEKGKLAVEGEGVFDAIDDTINYMILLKAMIKERQIEKSKDTEVNVFSVKTERSNADSDLVSGSMPRRQSESDHGA